MSHEVLLELGFLTENERDAINAVISKDVDIRKQEQSRISNLRHELDLLKENGLPEDEIEGKNEDYCARCQTYFGVLWNRGAACRRCSLKVCKVCRINGVDNGWICTLCSKVREVKAQSGAWFFQGHKEKNGNLFGSMLVRKSLRRKLSSQDEKAEGTNYTLSSADEKQYNDDHLNENHLPSRKESSEINGTLLSEKPSEELYSDEYSDDESPAHEEYQSAGTGSESRHSKEDIDDHQGLLNDQLKMDEDSEQQRAAQPAASPGYQSPEEFDDEHYKLPDNQMDQGPPGTMGIPESSHPTTLRNIDSHTDQGPNNPEVSPAEDDATLASRGDVLCAFSQTFASLPTREGTKNERSLSDGNSENEPSFSETSGYVTPTPSEGADSRSKQTPSISGDDQPTGIPNDEERAAEQASIIVTSPNHASQASPTILEYEEDISFHKYEMGLDNRKLKDQLSLGSRESIASYYSNAGGEVYGNYPVTGEIYFGLKYDAKTEEFNIQVHQARGIAAVDEKHHISDPYVKTYLLPDRSRGGKRKTRVKKNTINPVFDEIISYKVSYDELLHRTLWLAVWNHDRFGHNDFLGEVLIPIDEYRQSGFSLEDPEPQWYHLCERQPGDQDLSYNGELVIALKYVPPSAVQVTKKKKKKKKSESEKGELHVNIIEATSLLAKDSNGFSDPFCKSYLLPDKSKKTKQKTAVVKKSLNPKWNHQFVYDNVTHEDLMDRVLELTVWDFDRGSSNEFLGGVRLGLGAGLQEWDDANAEEQAAWNKMLNNHNNWNQVTLTLRDNMSNHNCYGSEGHVSHSDDPFLMEIRPHERRKTYPFEITASPISTPDEELLIRHSEYHRPPESKIVAAMRASGSRSATFTPGQSTVGADGQKLTLAELVKLRRKSATVKDEVHSPSSSTYGSSPNITIEAPPTDGNELVRHSEFYKVSKHSPTPTRRSIDIGHIPPSDQLQERRPTLVDMLEKPKDDLDVSKNGDEGLKVDQQIMGSMESVYSADVTFSNNDVTGEILIGYQYLNGMFVIKIFEARGLTAIDKNKNTSDPYVKVYLLPDQSRAGKRKTKVRHATLDPEFNEELLYKLGTRDLLTSTIWLTLWNYDRFGRNEFLGEVRIPLEEYDGKEVHATWYNLSEMPPGTIPENHGEIVVALMYSPAEKKKKKDSGKLYVKIIEARNLIGKDANNLSDPFCKCYLLPDESKGTKKKTPVLKRNLNPHWNYKFSYDQINLEELRNRVVELTVWDHDLGSSNDFLGGVRIGLGTGTESWDDSEGKEVTLWKMLLSKANTWTEGVLPLRNQMGSRKGLKT